MNKSLPAHYMFLALGTVFGTGMTFSLAGWQMGVSFLGGIVSAGLIFISTTILVRALTPVDLTENKAKHNRNLAVFAGVLKLPLLGGAAVAAVAFGPKGLIFFVSGLLLVYSALVWGALAKR